MRSRLAWASVRSSMAMSRPVTVVSSSRYASNFSASSSAAPRSMAFCCHVSCPTSCIDRRGVPSSPLVRARARLSAASRAAADKRSYSTTSDGMKARLGLRTLRRAASRRMRSAAVSRAASTSSGRCVTLPPTSSAACMSPAFARRSATCRTNAPSAGSLSSSDGLRCSSGVSAAVADSEGAAFADSRSVGSRGGCRVASMAGGGVRPSSRAGDGAP
mmetsp:Transcript_13702/g.42642  ORF Transcript_13702/g.42642 Transcript_13702/m.42642 type:complete len:217 (-) Transcript_13702:318-968(-)